MLRNLGNLKYRLRLRQYKCSDPSLLDANEEISNLNKLFTKLEAEVIENKKILTSLHSNISRTGEVAQDICNDEHPMNSALTILRLDSEGESTLKDEKSTVASVRAEHRLRELQAFNREIKNLRGLHDACLERHWREVYYARKIDAIEEAEERGIELNERVQRKKSRFEQKLNDITRDLTFLVEKLSRDLESVHDRRDTVLAVIMEHYLRTNHEFFTHNPVENVMASVPMRAFAVRTSSPWASKSFSECCRTFPRADTYPNLGSYSTLPSFRGTGSFHHRGKAPTAPPEPRPMRS